MILNLLTYAQNDIGEFKLRYCFGGLLKAASPAVSQKSFLGLDLEEYLELGPQIFTEFQYHAETFENEVFDAISQVQKIQKNTGVTMDFSHRKSIENPMETP